jgi:hypothetical protein
VGIMVFGTTPARGVGRSTGAKLLRDIYANTLAYRLAEMEHVLAFEKEENEKYIGRMESELTKLERNKREFETLLVTGEEKAAYAAFITVWKAYLKESNTTLSLSRKNLHQQAMSALTESSRALFEKSRRKLDILVEANAKYPESWSGLIKVFFRENRLARTLLYICGVTAFLIFIFNLFDKIKKRCNWNNLSLRSKKR